ncbi:tail fiber protein [Shewanella sp.]|uniref:tail fiber protein n=1 Tax=Shewanella sp. TaxID=50422 RepID=UPI0025D05ECA|nr:tail fiber protein [Shewanella sp.]
MSVNINAGPTVAELKEQFKSRSIPLESDFSALIDVADHGRKAVGLSPQQSPNQSCGLALDNGGQLEVKIKSNGGMMVDETGMSIVPEQQFHRGMIMMFSGSSAPTGWALCNGDTVDGMATPDLRRRFILGGEFNDFGQSSARTYGSTSGKYHTMYTNSQQPAVSVTVNNRSLTIAQMPEHDHLDGRRTGLATDKLGVYEYGYTFGSGHKLHRYSGSDYQFVNAYLLANTSKVGSGAGHNHTTSASQSSHNHSVNAIPPYYTLAFIIKT